MEEEEDKEEDDAMMGKEGNKTSQDAYAVRRKLCVSHHHGTIFRGGCFSGGETSSERRHAGIECVVEFLYFMKSSRI